MAKRGSGQERSVKESCQILIAVRIRQFQGMMRRMVLMALLSTALAQIGSYTLNCRIADVDAKLCIICLQGYKLDSGTCTICQTGYALQGTKCLPISITPTAPPKTDPLPPVSQFPTYTSTNAIPITQTSFLPSFLQSGLITTPPQPAPQTPSTPPPPATLPTPIQPPPNTPKYVDPNCKTLSISSCQECYPSFYFNTTLGKCIAVNPLCKTVTSKNQCTSCYEGYLLSNGDCSIGSKAVAASVADASQRDRNCKNATSWGCNECYPGFYVDKIQNKCLVANSRCKTVSPSNACTSCYPGYTLLSDDCKMNSAIVNAVTTPVAKTPKPTTTSVSTVNSFVLYSGYYFEVAPNGQIVGIFSSKNGSQLNPASSSDPYCSQYTGGTCSSCVSRYSLTAQGCKPFNQQCKTWVGALCIECPSGYVLSANNCNQPSQPAPSPPVPKTTTTSTPIYASSSETACFFRFVRVSGVCIKVDDQCREWSTIDAKCTSCYPGYSLSSGSCIISA